MTVKLHFDNKEVLYGKPGDEVCRCDCEKSGHACRKGQEFNKEPRWAFLKILSTFIAASLLGAVVIFVCYWFYQVSLHYIDP